MNPYRQKPVSAAIWPWTSPRAGDPGAQRKKDVQRAIAQSAVAGAIGLLLLLALHRRVLGAIVLAIAAFVLVSGLFLPPAFHALDKFGRWLGKAVGTALTWLLLVPFFYLCFVPARALMGLLKKDPLKLKFSTAEASYWTPRPPVNAEQVRKQY